MLFRTRRAGSADQILVFELPEQLVDDTIEPVQTAVRAALPQSDGAALVLDAANLALLNSLGITALLQIQDLCRTRQAGMAIAALPQSTRTLLSQLRLDKRFDLYGTVDEAVVSLESGM